jgi:hypothetical protein
MYARRFGLPAAVFAGVVSAAGLAWALGFELGETKEQLKLKYDVSAADHGTGRVTVTLTIADEGRLAPLSRGVDLVVRSKDGSGYADLSVSLERTSVEGKQVMRAHLAKELAERAEIRLQTNHLDGKQEPRTWYYHRIPIADYLKAADPKPK